MRLTSHGSEQNQEHFSTANLMYLFAIQPHQHISSDVRLIFSVSQHAKSDVQWSPASNMLKPMIGTMHTYCAGLVDFVSHMCALT